MYTKACEVLSQSQLAHMCKDQGLLPSLPPCHTNNGCVHCSIAACKLPREHQCIHQGETTKIPLPFASSVGKTGCLQLNNPKTVVVLRDIVLAPNTLLPMLNNCKVHTAHGALTFGMLILRGVCS